MIRRICIHVCTFSSSLLLGLHNLYGQKGHAFERRGNSFLFLIYTKFDSLSVCKNFKVWYFDWLRFTFLYWSQARALGFFYNLVEGGFFSSVRCLRYLWIFQGTSLGWGCPPYSRSIRLGLQRNWNGALVAAASRRQYDASRRRRCLQT